MAHRLYLLAGIFLVLGLVPALACAQIAPPPVEAQPTTRPAAGMPNPFFAMDTGTRDATHQTPESQVAMLADLGYAGIGPEYRKIGDPQEMLASLDKHGLKMFALWMELDIDAGKAAIGADYLAAIKALRGRDTVLWVCVHSKKYKPSSAEGDEVAVAAIGELADQAAAANLKISLYPHVGAWVERVEDGVRVIEKAKRQNIGVTFNLCHWLKVDGKDLRATLTRAKSYLSLVTINGADSDGQDWGKLIQPLDTGTYDVAGVLRILVELNYQGPIGLQHYGIGGDCRQNLQRSMNGWRKLSAGATTRQPASGP
jgi:sugar phosphate isomerase/epimerase